MITLVFQTSKDAETAWEEYFSEPSDSILNTQLDRRNARIEIEPCSGGETHLEIPDGLIAIII